MTAAQPSLFPAGAVDPTPQVGDPLGRMYTPQPLAEACLRRVLMRAAIGTGHTVVEPSVGGGAFVRAMRAAKPKAKLVGVDVDPDARGFELVDDAYHMDTITWSIAHRMAGRPADLVIGNPPFGDALEHVEALLELRPFRLALILPLDRLGRQGWRDVLYGVPVEGMVLRELHPILPRPWGEHVREVALFVWGHNQPPAMGVRIMGPPIVWKGR